LVSAHRDLPAVKKRKEKERKEVNLKGSEGGSMNQSPVC
jgi:hypothetical protein